MSSGRDGALAPAQDIARVDVSFDDATGTWVTVVTLQGAPTASDSAAINLTLFQPPAAGAACGSEPRDGIALMRTDIHPGSSVLATATPFSAPRAAEEFSREQAPGPDAVTLRLTDSSLVGAQPACARITTSRHAFLDQVDVPLAAPGAAPSPTPVPALRLRFTHTDARLTASRTGVVTVTLEHFSRAVSGTVTLRPRGGGHALGSARYRASANRAVRVRVKLTAAARRSLRRHGRLLVRLTATARAGDAKPLQRTTRATIRRAAKR